MKSIISQALFASIWASVAIASIEYKPFQVPSFSLNDPSVGPHVAQALQTYGIIGLKEFDTFAETKSQYLQAAAACIASEKGLTSDRLLQKILSDGTVRYTISTKSSDTSLNKSNDVVANCPDYDAALGAYSKIVDTASMQLAKLLDGLSTDKNGAEPLTQVISHGEHLDHFHGYSNPIAKQSNPAKKSLSLEVHTDAGMMIFTAAPTFYKNNNQQVESIANPDTSSGLVIQLSEGAELVRPVLKDDELYVMIGEGFNSWGSFGHTFRPVPHGMVMPSFENADESIIRAFPGRMILMEAHHTMANTGVSFEQYANATTRYLLQSAEDDVISLACPAGRVLIASDSSCTLQYWEPTDNSATKAQCMKWCNSGMGNDLRQCKVKKCKKTGEAPGGGTDCWMLCVENLTPDQCPVSGHQECTADQHLVCEGLPVTTKPVTTSPATTAPVTTVPVTTLPATTAPVTSKPVTTVPATTLPVTTNPATTEPVSTKPITTAPTTTQPVTTTAPITPVPQC